MGRKANNTVTLPDGRKIPYSVWEKEGKGNGFWVSFKGPFKRHQKTLNTTSQAIAYSKAENLIADEYQGAPLPGKDTPLVSWEEAISKLERAMLSAGKSKHTLYGYEYHIRALLRFYPDSVSPLDITPAKAQHYRDSWTAKAPAAVQTYLNILSAIWGEWFKKELKLVPVDPWKDIPRPAVPKKEIIRTLDQSELEHFKGWLVEAFPGFIMPSLWFRLKLITGCRSSDISSLPSSCLKDGCIEFPPEIRKKRDNPRFPLPPGLYAALDAIKGKVYLWENWKQERMNHYQGNAQDMLFGKRSNKPFNPRNLVKWFQKTLERYRKAYPLRSHFVLHNTRSTTISNLHKEGFTVEEAGEIVGCTREVIEKHYLAFNKEGLREKGMERLAKLYGEA